MRTIIHVAFRISEPGNIATFLISLHQIYFMLVTL